MSRKYGVFISYSHEDAVYISPIIKLLAVGRKDLVFRDTENIQPGKKWESQLLDALNEAKTIVVFWCKHSAKSAFVKKEYTIAMKNNKEVIPLLIDDSKLPKSLAAYEGIDLRDTNFHQKPPRHTNKKGGTFGYDEDHSYYESLYKITNNLISELNKKIPPLKATTKLILPK